MTQVMNPETSTAIGWGNRGSLDIMNYILLACIEGKMMTHIMYMCNMNSKQAQSYVALLLKYRLLEKRETESFKNNVFRTMALAGKVYWMHVPSCPECSLSLTIRTRRSPWSEGR